MPEPNETQETAIQKVQPTTIQRTQATTFAPTNLAEALRFAEMVARSGMAPKDYAGKPEAIVVAIQMGMEVGLQPMQSLQNIAVINGRPSIWGDGALALVKVHPEFEWIKEDDSETIAKNGKAVCVIKRRGQPEYKVVFSKEDAKTAGLLSKAGPWTTYPNRMLQMRARGFAIRDAFPDALKGIITAEEAMDMPIIDGGKLESVPTETAQPAPTDPNELPITMENCAVFYKTWKENGWHIADAKSAVQQIAGVEKSNEVKRKFFADLMKWAESKPGDAKEPAQEQAQ